MSYQFVHFGISFWSGFILYKIIGLWYVLFVGALIGILVEGSQVAKITGDDSKEFVKYKVKDTVRDLIFWFGGVAVLFLVKMYPL